MNNRKRNLFWIFFTATFFTYHYFMCLRLAMIHAPWYLIFVNAIFASIQCWFFVQFVLLRPLKVKVNVDYFSGEVVRIRIGEYECYISKEGKEAMDKLIHSSPKQPKS